MKRMLFGTIVVLALMLCTAAMAVDDGADPLDMEELRDWAQTYRRLAEETAPMNDPHDADALTEDGYAYVYQFGTLYFDRPELTADAVLQSVMVFDSEAQGPHGTLVGLPAEMVLDAYYNENETLAGTREYAVLYVSDDLPQAASAGVVLRDGQRLQAVEYRVWEQTEDGIMSSGVIYTIEEGLVAAVRAYGLNEVLEQGRVAADLAALKEASLEQAYVRVPTSLNGTDLEMFTEDDLVFAGLDVLELTAEGATEIMGDMIDDVWMEDGEDYIRVTDFESCELVCQYGADRQEGRFASLTIFADGPEGPRGVRVGDTLSSVMCRFRSGEGDFSGMTELLYGTDGVAPYAVAEYGADASAMLRYAAPLTNGRTALMMLTIEQLKVKEILITVMD